MTQTTSLSAETETLSQVLSLVEAFRAFDGDNDGAISKAELGALLSSIGYTASPQDVAAMMTQGDKDNDGLLSIQEFLEMNTKDLCIGSELVTSLRTVFEALPLAGDGRVTAEELFVVMENLGVEVSLEDCQGIVDSMDADGDGAVSLDDFKLILDALL